MASRSVSRERQAAPNGTEVLTGARSPSSDSGSTHSRTESDEQPSATVANETNSSNNTVVPRSLMGNAEEECPICRSAIADRAVTNTCRHGFDRQCLESYIRQPRMARPTCPVCRSPFTEIYHQIQSEVNFQTIQVTSLIPPGSGVGISVQLDELLEILGMLRGGQRIAIMTRSPTNATRNSSNAANQNASSPIGEERATSPSSHGSTQVVVGSRSPAQVTSPEASPSSPSSITVSNDSGSPVVTSPESVPNENAPATSGRETTSNVVSADGNQVRFGSVQSIQPASPQIRNTFRAYRNVDNQAPATRVRSPTPGPISAPLAVRVQRRIEQQAARGEQQAARGRQQRGRGQPRRRRGGQVGTAPQPGARIAGAVRVLRFARGSRAANNQSDIVPPQDPDQNQIISTIRPRGARRGVRRGPRNPRVGRNSAGGVSNPSAPEPAPLPRERYGVRRAREISVASPRDVEGTSPSASPVDSEVSVRSRASNWSEDGTASEQSTISPLGQPGFVPRRDSPHPRARRTRSEPLLRRSVNSVGSRSGAVVPRRQRRNEDRTTIRDREVVGGRRSTGSRQMAGSRRFAGSQRAAGRGRVIDRTVVTRTVRRVRRRRSSRRSS